MNPKAVLLKTKKLLARLIKKKNRNCKLPTSPITGDTSINSIDAKRIKGHFAYL